MSSSSLSVTPNPTHTPLRRRTLTPHTLNPTNTPKTNRKTKPIKPLTKLRKKTVSKRSRDRSPWKTIAKVVVKNLSLVVILLLLIQMIRRLAVSRTGGLVNAGLGYESRIERRIMEVKEMVIGIEKMVKVRVEVVEKKVASEVSRLRNELGGKIDGGRVEGLNKFSEFDGRVGSIERLMRSGERVLKEEFDRVVTDIMGRKGVSDVREFKFKEIVENEIGKHAADGVGRVDYAVASGGGKVVKHSEGFRGGGWFSGSVRDDAVKMLQPSFGQPGECFAFKGDSGFVEIKLRGAIVPEAVTLEHVSKSVAFDRSTAPKECKVWGWSCNKEKEHLLTEFTYDLEKSSSQTFNVSFHTKGVNPIIIDTIRLHFMSNHGNPTHTCIYRVRVHGHQPDVS